jgi:hypothetical protein
MLFKFLLASMKTLTNYGDFTGSRINFPPPPNKTVGNSKRTMKLNSPFEKATINHSPVILKSNTKARFKIISGLRNNLQITCGFLYAATSNLKRVTVRIFTINKCFHRSKPKSNLLFSPLQGSRKI